MNAETLSEQIVFRDYQPEDAIPAITALLHEAYGALARMGFRYVASHQDHPTTERRLARGFPLMAALNGRIIGTVTLYATDAKSECEWYAKAGVFHFGQFAVHPELQRLGVGIRLLQLTEDHARARGAEELALDTAEGAIHLRDWYERLGYRLVQYISWPQTNYRSVVLSKQLHAPGEAGHRELIHSL